MIFTFWIAPAQLLEQRRPVHFRHDHVRHHQVDVSVLVESLDRLDTVAGFQHRVAARREPSCVQRPQAVLIFDEQDRALPGQVCGGGPRHRVRGRHGAGDGRRFRGRNLRKHFLCARNVARQENTE